MSTRRPPQPPRTEATPQDPQEHWNLAKSHDNQAEPLRGGLRDTSRLLAIITTAIAIVAVSVAVLLLPL